MPQTSPDIQQIQVESARELRTLLGDSPTAFLKNLATPTWIVIKGQDTFRSRAIVTLLHANEPSGLKAIHRLLQRGIQPKTNLGVFVASVEAALETPAFSHRHLPDEEDLNRCFGQSLGNTSGKSELTNQQLLANNFMTLLADFKPEAVVDTHNTSGHSEVFAVAVNSDTKTRQISQLFCQRLVVIQQPMGTLIEQNIHCPIVTVEFGGFLDPRADQCALESLEQYIQRDELFAAEPQPTQTLTNPFRLKVAPSCQLAYASTVDHNAELTIFNTIDQLNFHQLEAGTAIGWIEPSHFELLVVLDSRADSKETNIAETLFLVQDGVLQTRVAMTIFMATTDAQIAKGDCLLYVCPEASI